MAIYVGTIGFPVYLKMHMDISAADGGGAAVKARMCKPDGTVSLKTVTLEDKPNGIIKYVTVAGDFDLEGKYYFNPVWYPLGTGDDDIEYGKTRVLVVEALPA